MHPMLAEKYIEQCRQLEKDGDHPTVQMPSAEQLMFALLEVAHERDKLREKIGRLTKPTVVK